MILSVLEQFLLFLPLLFGAYISMSLMKITNLSIESAYLFGAILASNLLLDGYQGLPALIIALVASAMGGAIVGIIAGALSQKAGFSHVLSAIITVGLFQGISQMVIGGSHITLSNVYNPLQAFPYVVQYPNLVMTLFIALFLFLVFFLFLKTQLGMSCAIYGNNSSFLINYRMNQSYVVIAGLAISNALAGISGYLVAQSNGFVDLYMGTGLPLLCLSSLIIGKSIRKASAPVALSVPILGAMGYFMVQTFLLKVGFDLRYFTAVQAVIVAAMLLLSSRYLNQSSRQDLLGI